jgi:hypothetical protein
MGLVAELERHARRRANVAAGGRLFAALLAVITAARDVGDVFEYPRHAHEHIATRLRPAQAPLGYPAAEFPVLSGTCWNQIRISIIFHFLDSYWHVGKLG